MSVSNKTGNSGIQDKTLDFSPAQSLKTSLNKHACASVLKLVFAFITMPPVLNMGMNFRLHATAVYIEFRPWLCTNAGGTLVLGTWLSYTQ